MIATSATTVAIFDFLSLQLCWWCFAQSILLLYLSPFTFVLVLPLSVAMWVFKRQWQVLVPLYCSYSRFCCSLHLLLNALFRNWLLLRCYRCRRLSKFIYMFDALFSLLVMQACNSARWKRCVFTLFSTQLWIELFQGKNGAHNDDWL